MNGSATIEIKRLFLALWPDEATRARLVEVGRGIPVPAEKLVPAAGLHVTLVFMGNVSKFWWPQIDEIAGEVRAPPFTLVLDRWGTFGGTRVGWLGPTHVPDALARLQSALFSRLHDAGMPVEERPYRPHVTLARKITPPLDKALETPVEWPVSEFVLVESRTLMRGALYRVTKTWKLG